MCERLKMHTALLEKTNISAPVAQYLPHINTMQMEPLSDLLPGWCEGSKPLLFLIPVIQHSIKMQNWPHKHER